MKTVAEIMQTKVVSIPLDASMPEIERLLVQSKVSGGPVLDRDGTVCGVVSRSDVVRRLCAERSLAENFSDYYTDPAGFAGRAPDGESFDDIAQRVGVRMDHLRAADVISREIVAVAPTATVQEAAQTMMERAVHRLLVLDDGRLAGVVSSLDFVRLVAAG